MLESRAYLNFFKQNVLFLLLGLVLGGVGGYFYQLNKPVFYKGSSLYEINYDVSNITQKTLLVDEIVTVVRSKNATNKFDLTADSFLRIYKEGPLSFSVESYSPSPQKTIQIHNKIDSFLFSNYSIKVVGNFLIHRQRPAFSQVIPLTMAAGITAALFVSLLKLYFQKF